MNVLLSAVPWYYRALFMAMALAAVYGLGWIKGDEHGGAKIPEMVATQVTAAAKLARARDVVTTKVVTKYLPQLVKTEVVTETIIKEVPVYALPSDPPLPGRFRVFHDAAAQGIVPDAAGIADAAAVPLEDAETAVAENYGSCRQDKLKLQGLQEWITEQLKVNSLKAKPSE